MNQDETMNFSPSFICNKQTCINANQRPTFSSFCLFLSLTQISDVERKYEFSNVFLKGGYAYQHTHSLMSDSGSVFSCS